MASASQSVSQGASEQASSLEQISASMAEMVARVRRNAESAAQANALAAAAREAVRGTAHIQQVTAAMGQINAASQDLSRMLKTKTPERTSSGWY